MSGLRHVADTTLQEINSDTGQDLFGSLNDGDSRFKGSGQKKNRISDPTLAHMSVILQRQFEAAHQTLATQQRQVLKCLQQSCIEVVTNQTCPPRKAGIAWSDQPVTLPGNPLQNAMQCVQRPFTPAGCAPDMPGMIDAEAQLLQQVKAASIQRSSIDSTPVFTVQHEIEEDKPLNSVKRVSADSIPIYTVPAEINEDKPTISRMWSFRPTLDDDEDERAEIVKQSLKFAQYKARRKRISAAVESATASEISRAKKSPGSDPKQDPRGPKAVFADAAAMKAKVKENIMRPDYNVAMFYKTEGCAQQIARSNTFDNVTLAIIGLNALWIWIDTDYNDSPTLLDAHPFFQVGENLFCLYFFVELLIRFLAFKVKRDGLRDAWFVFDSALVLMMVIETWLLNLAFWIFGVGSSAEMGNASILRLVRLLRLTRMARMARLLRAMPELMILIKGISVAARSVLFTLVLLMLILYVFAIAFRQLCAEGELEDSHFRTVPEAMNTLLLQGVLPDQGGLVTELGDVNYIFGAVVLLFILLSSLTIMNMLVGVLCEVVSVVSSVEKEEMMLNFVKTKLAQLIQESGIDKDENLCLSKEEFEELLLLPEGARVIQEVGVDVVVLVDLLDHIFSMNQELSFSDIMELVLQLRGTNTATVRDVVDLRKFLTQLATESHDHVIERVSEVVSYSVFNIVEQQFKKQSISKF